MLKTVFFLYLYKFQLMDKNEDGVISEMEFLEGCEKVEMPATQLFFSWW